MIYLIAKKNSNQGRLIMVKNATEIKEIIEKNKLSEDNSIYALFNALSVQSIFSRQASKIKRTDVGHEAMSIMILFLVLPVFLAKSVNSYYKSFYGKSSEMKKDTLYRFMNNEKMCWRSLLLSIGVAFIKKTRNSKDISSPSVFVLDDTTLEKRGSLIEGVSLVYDHTKNKCVEGYKLLTLGYYDGLSFIPLDNSFHSEKPLSIKKRKKQHQKERSSKSSGFKRKKELLKTKIASALEMIKRATKRKISADYIAFDSWFFGENFIKEILKIGEKSGVKINVACAVKSSINFVSNGKSNNSGELRAIASKNHNGKRCRSFKNCIYYQFDVEYKKIPLRLFVSRLPGQKKWHSFISTDKSLSFVEFMKIYSIRWGIEVFFKESKQLLGLGKCQSNTFDAQIASAARAFILYTVLSYYKRSRVTETIGGLFCEVSDNIKEMSLAEKIFCSIFCKSEKLKDACLQYFLETNPEKRKDFFAKLFSLVFFDVFSQSDAITL